MLDLALFISSMRGGSVVGQRNVMSVLIPEYEVHQEGEGLSYGLANTSGSLDLSLERFSALLPRLIHLAAEEKGLKLMATEIEKTRRRVNALEHVLIPSFQETVRYITMKLDEQERAGLSRLMRIKEIVRSH